MHSLHTTLLVTLLLLTPTLTIPLADSTSNSSGGKAAGEFPPKDSTPTHSSSSSSTGAPSHVNFKLTPENPYEPPSPPENNRPEPKSSSWSDTIKSWLVPETKEGGEAGVGKATEEEQEEEEEGKEDEEEEESGGE